MRLEAEGGCSGQYSSAPMLNRWMYRISMLSCSRCWLSLIDVEYKSALQYWDELADEYRTCLYYYDAGINREC